MEKFNCKRISFWFEESNRPDFNLDFTIKSNHDLELSINDGDLVIVGKDRLIELRDAIQTVLNDNRFI